MYEVDPRDFYFNLVWQAIELTKDKLFLECTPDYVAGYYKAIDSLIDLARDRLPSECLASTE